ncbi:hypothetical protein GCM10025861_15210 [Methanobacterium petrolearium]|nr:hypothetical protein GCM10025861_15210 [Methanobacterium petrolearium]
MFQLPWDCWIYGIKLALYQIPLILYIMINNVKLTIMFNHDKSVEVIMNVKTEKYKRTPPRRRWIQNINR